MDLSNENIIHMKKDGIEYLQFRRLLEFDNLINCYTLSANDVDFRRKFPNEKSYILDKSYENICNALNITQENIVRPIQAHTDRVEIVESATQKYRDVDGLLTDKSDINLMLTYADCTPILLYDPVKKVIGNIHSGWRGTAQKIGQKAVKKMVDEFNSKAEDIIACIGPCIGKCHFEVDEDVKNIFEQSFSYLNRNYDIIEQQKDKNKYNIDTTLINRLILEEIGLKKENIVESKICTVCNSNLIHSYRKDGQNSGRNVAILGKRK